MLIALFYIYVPFNLTMQLGLTHLWDNGSNVVDELNRVMKVRAFALKNFSEKNIAEGSSYATLEDALVPLYMFHRYQLEACTKLIGGLYYRYAMRGDGQEINRIVPAKEQRQALEAILESSWSLPINNSYHAEILRVTNYSILNHLMSLAADESETAQVHAIALYKLEELKNKLVQKSN